MWDKRQLKARPFIEKHQANCNTCNNKLIVIFFIICDKQQNKFIPNKINTFEHWFFNNRMNVKYKG